MIYIKLHENLEKGGGIVSQGVERRLKTPLPHSYAKKRN